MATRLLSERSGTRPAQPPVGLVAGWGRLPIIVAEALKAQGHPVYCVGLAGHADPVLADICDGYLASGIARLGAHIRYFRRRGIREATLAGKVFKSKVLFSKFGWLPLLPDLRTIRTFLPIYVLRKKDRADDTLLTTVVEQYALDGIRLAPATDFAPELLVKPGPLTRRQPTATEQDDIAFGWRLAKEMGRLDVGQSVAVKGRAVIAVEAVEGTDECIKRAGQLCPQGGFTVVKVAKPQQDMRFDVPTIGLGTIQTLAAAGAKVLAIEARKTIVLDQADVVREADKHGLTIVAMDESEVQA
jgi:UDP-2,3-diacylglucosamine hydrolase